MSIMNRPALPTTLGDVTWLFGTGAPMTHRTGSVEQERVAGQSTHMRACTLPLHRRTRKV